MELFYLAEFRFPETLWSEGPQFIKENQDLPGSPVVETLPSSAGGVGSIPGWRAKTPQASWPKQNIKKKKKAQNKYCNKSNKDQKKKKGPH